MHVKSTRRGKKKMFKDPVLIDTDGQLDSFWGLVLAKRFLDVKAVTVCGGKNNNPEDAFKNVPGFVKMAGLSCSVSKGSERRIISQTENVDCHFRKVSQWMKCRHGIVFIKKRKKPRGI